MARSILLGLLAASLLAACAAPGPQGPVDGAAVYRARCAMCHPPWSPRDFTPQEWPRYVKKYAPRAGLSGEEREAVLAFLVAESSGAR